MGPEIIAGLGAFAALASAGTGIAQAAGAFAPKAPEFNAKEAAQRRGEALNRAARRSGPFEDLFAPIVGAEATSVGTSTIVGVR